MIRVLQFADVVNRDDFIDVIVQRANPSLFSIGLCTRTARSTIAIPSLDARIPRWVIRGTARWSIPYTALRLALVLRAWKADILHTHHYDQAIIGWMATRIYPATRLFIGRHYSNAIYRLPPGIKREILLHLEQGANRAATRIIVPSTYILDILTKKQGVDAAKVDLIPYGFEPTKYETPLPEEIRRIREELQLSGRFSIATISRLDEQKGHRYLLRATAMLKDRLPNLLVLFAGVGPERGAIEREIRQRGLEGVVKLLGHRRDAMALIAAADAVVQPTLQEAFSQVMAEAMWMQKPLLITEVGGAVDIIENGRNGLLVPIADAVALSEAIERIATDRALRDRLGACGRAYAEENLSVERIIPRYERSYLQALQAGA